MLVPIIPIMKDQLDDIMKYRIKVYYVLSDNTIGEGVLESYHVHFNNEINLTVSDEVNSIDRNTHIGIKTASIVNNWVSEYNSK